MKYEVRWSSPTQGTRSTVVDALTLSTAQEQVESMYANIKGFNVIYVTPVFDKKEQPEVSESYSSSSSYESSDVDQNSSFSDVIGGASIFAGAVIFLFGLFYLPAGIIAMVVGGAVGFFGMKLAFLMSDKGW